MWNRRQGARTALVVEDDPALLALLRAGLWDEGVRPTCVTRGQQARAALARQPFDLLLLDLDVPDLNGLDLCTAVRERYGDAPVIIVVSADNRPRRWVAALGRGVGARRGRLHRHLLR